MEFSKIQEELYKRCANCFSEIEIPLVPIKVEDGIGAETAFNSSSSEINVFEAVAFIHNWTTMEFKDRLLRMENLQSNTVPDDHILISMCAVCKPILFELFNLYQEFNHLSNENSILYRSKQFQPNKIYLRNVKVESACDNSDIDENCNDNFLLRNSDVSETLFNSTEYESDAKEIEVNSSKAKFDTTCELPGSNNSRKYKSRRRLRRAKKKLVVNDTKKVTEKSRTVCTDVTIALQRLDGNAVESHKGASKKRRVIRINLSKRKKHEAVTKECLEQHSEEDFETKRLNRKRKNKSRAVISQLYKCNKCDRNFYQKKLLDNHKKTHKKPKFDPGPGPFKCPHCPKQITNYRNFRFRHLLAHEKDLSVICDICGKRSSCYRQLRVHKRVVHCEGGATKKSLCNVCGKYFRILSLHMPLHDEVRKFYTCDLCGKSYKTKFGWKDHVQGAHSGQKFKCKTCGKDFETRMNLSCHEKLHLQERPYACERCPKTFRIQSALKSHFRTHSDARPYVCNLCGKDYKRNSQYITHMEGHKSKDLGTAVFSCSQCGQIFKNKCTLGNHVRDIHRDQTQRNQHACSTCSKRFRDSYNLKVHRRNVHKEDV